MNRKITLLIMLTIAAITTANAQTDTMRYHRWFKHDIAGAVQIQVTYRKGNTLQLNQDLNKAGIPSLSSNDVWINASMAHYNHNWIMEDGLGFTPTSTATSANNLKARYNQYQAYFRTGYNVLTEDDIRLYPFVGLNFSAAVLDIQDNARIQNTSDFTTELLNSTSSKTFYQPNFGIELGGGFDYLIKMKPKRKEFFTVQRSIPIGIRAGYYINTYASDWRIDNYGFGNSPNQKQSAVFLSFNIGLGYEVKK